jgi:phenylacetate-CoA ligase
VRARLESAWGARVFDHWGMTEIGPLATEAADDPACLTVLETECIAEILDPQSGHPVANGELGELVVTNLGRIDSPVIRYRTGDLVRAAVDLHPSGRILLRLPGGVLGRVDDMLIIRGNNVFPSSLEAVVREYAEIAEFRIVVSRQREMDHLRLDIEPIPEATDHDDLLARMRHKIQERLSFQAEVRTVSPGTLPRFEMKARRVVREP